MERNIIMQWSFNASYYMLLPFQGLTRKNQKLPTREKPLRSFFPGGPNYRSVSPRTLKQKKGGSQVEGYLETEYKGALKTYSRSLS